MCGFDPYGERKYLYEFESRCVQDLSMDMRDGSQTYFLSTKGSNPEGVPKELVKFLEFVGADLEESMNDFEDDYVKQLQDTIQDIKVSRKMEEKFMTLEELIKDERKAVKAEGKAEAILVLLSYKGEVPGDLATKILSEKKEEVLVHLLELVAKTDSIEQFMKEMESVLV